MATAKKAKRSAPKKSKPAAKTAAGSANAKAKAKSARSTKRSSRSGDDRPAVAPPAKARAEYESLLREISVAERDELRGWDRKWEAVATVLAKRYYLFDDEANTAPLWRRPRWQRDCHRAPRSVRASLAQRAFDDGLWAHRERSARQRDADRTHRDVRV